MAGTSVIHYKFVTARDHRTVTLDCETVRVFDIKKAIVRDRGLDRGVDLELEIANEQTNQVYADETMLVPKNTSVLVRRLPNRGPMGLLARLRANTPLSTANMYDEYAGCRRLCGGTPYVVYACSVGSGGLVGWRACTVLVGIRKLAPFSGAAGQSGVALWRWNELRAGEGKTLVAWHDLRVSLSMEKSSTGSVSDRGSPLALSRSSEVLKTKRERSHGTFLLGFVVAEFRERLSRLALLPYIFEGGAWGKGDGNGLPLRQRHVFSRAGRLWQFSYRLPSRARHESPRHGSKPAAEPSYPCYLRNAIWSRVRPQLSTAYDLVDVVHTLMVAELCCTAACDAATVML